MQLFELGQQYEATAEALLLRIHQLNAIAKTLHGNDLILMKRRIVSLYSDSAECHRCAEFLKSYERK